MFSFKLPNELDKDKGITPKPTSGGLKNWDEISKVGTQPKLDMPSTVVSTVNPEEYSDYMNQVRLEGEDRLMKARAENQAWYEQAAAFVNQAVIGEVVGGSLSAVGSLYEVPGLIYDKFTGEASDFNNGLISLGDDIMQWTRGATPIYRKNPTKAWDVGDKGWWFSNAVSIASAASMLVPAKGTITALSWMNKLATATGKIAKAKGLEKTGRLLTTGQRMGISKDIIKQGTSAFVMRHAENTRESFAVVNDVKQELNRKWTDEKEWEKAQNTKAADDLAARGLPVTKENLANHIASEAGHRAYNVNFSNIIFDFIQAGALIKGTALTRSTVRSPKVRAELARRKKGKFVTEAQEKAANEIADKMAKSKFSKIQNYGGTLLRQSTEGLEEMVNFVGEKEGKAYAEYLQGEDDSTFGQRVAKYMDDPHLTEVAFWGALGGIAFEKIGHAFGGNPAKLVQDQQLATIAMRGEETSNLVAQIQKVKAEFAAGKITMEEANERINNAKSKSGNLMGVHAAINGTTNVLLEQLDNGQFRDDVLNDITQEELNEIGAGDINVAIAKLKEEVLTAEKNYKKYRKKVFGLDVDAEGKSRVLYQLLQSVAARDRFNYLQNKKINEYNAFFDNENSVLQQFDENNPSFKSSMTYHAEKEHAEMYKLRAELETLRGNKRMAAIFTRMQKRAEANLKDVESRFDDNYKLFSIEDMQKLFKDNNLSEDLFQELATLEGQIISNSAERTEASYQVNNLLTDKGAQEFNNFINGAIEKKKEADTSVEFQKYKASVIQEVNKYASFDEQKVYLEGELTGLEKDSKEYKYIQKLLTDVENKKRLSEENDDGDLDLDVNYDDTIGTLDELTVEFKTELNQELKTTTRKFIQNLKNTVTNVKYSINEKLKRLNKMRETAIQQNNPNALKLINNQIYAVQREQRKESFKEKGKIILGDSYISSTGDIITVKEIYTDGNNNTVIVAIYNGVRSIFYYEDFISAVSKGTLVLNKPAKTLSEIKQERDALIVEQTALLNEKETQEIKNRLFDIQQQINELDLLEKEIMTPLEERQVIDFLPLFANITSIVELLNHPLISAQTKALAAHLESLGLTVQFFDDNTMGGELAIYASDQNAIDLNQEYIESITVAELVEMLEHEMVHAELDRLIPRTNSQLRAEFNGDLKAIIDTLVPTADEKTKVFINIILNEANKKDGNPEELLNYVLSNQAVFDILQLEQNNILEDIRRLLNKYKVDTLKGLYNNRVAAGVKPANPNIKITKAGQELLTRLLNKHNIDVNDIKGTGVNGNVTLKDVQKYAKDNKLNDTFESLQKINLTSDTFKSNDANVNNLYLPTLLAITEDGTIDVDVYMAEMRKLNPKWSTKMPKNELQATLEDTMKVLLDPTLNAGTPVTLKVRGNGIAIMFKGFSIGFINNPTTLREQIKFLEKIDNMDNVADLKQLLNTPEGKKEFYESSILRKISNLEKTGEHKPISEQLDNHRQQLATVLKIKNQIQNAPIGSNIVATVKRKSSGNLLQVEKYEAVSDVMPEIQDLYYVPINKNAAGTRTTLVNAADPKDSKREFNRNPNAGDYHNHDNEYDIGVPYMLVPGANSIPGQINTYIPVRLQSTDISETSAETTTETIFELIDFLNSTQIKQLSWKNLKNNAVFQSLKEKLNRVVNVNLDNKITADYFKVFDNKIEFNFGDNQIIRIQLTSKFQKSKVSKVVNVEYIDSTGAEIPLPTGKAGSPLVKTLSLYKADGVTEFDGRRDKIKQIIKKALTQKRHNIDFTALADTSSFVVGDTTYANYKEYVLKNVAQTDTRHLKDKSGNILKDSSGKPLPPITQKNTSKRTNSNLIIGIDSNLSGLGNKEASKQETKSDNTKTTEEEKSVENLATINTDSNNKGVITPEKVKEGVDALIKDGAIVVESKELAFKLEDYIYDNNMTNKVIDFTFLSDGTVKIVLKEDTDSGISDDTDRNKRVQEGDEAKEKESAEDVKAWWKKTFGENVPLDMNIVGMIQSKGEKAWGVFTNGMVRLSLDAPKGTAYHEAFHVVFWLYTTPEQRVELFKEARAKYGNKNNLTLEEAMADAFMDYVMMKGRTKKVSGKTKGFFAKIYKWLTDFFLKKDASKMEQLFKDIDSGKFNYKPDAETVAFANKYVTRNKLVSDDLTRADQAEVISLMAKKLFEYQNANMDATLEDIVNGTVAHPRNAILQSLNKAKRLKGANRVNINLITANTEVFNELYDMTVKYVKRQFGIENSKTFVNFDKSTEIEKKWDDAAIFQVSQKATVSNFVKGKIMSTVVMETKNTVSRNTFLGLDTFLDFNKVYPYIQRNMTGATNYAEMEARLESMALHDPSYYNIIKELQNDSNFKAAWISQFKKAAPQVDVILYSDEEIKLDNANKNTSYFILANKWQSSIEASLLSRDLTAEKISQITKQLNTAYNLATYSIEGNKLVDPIAAVEAIVKAYNELGISLTTELVNKTISSKITNNVFGSPYDSLTEIFKNNFDAIVGGIETQIEDRNYLIESIGMSADSLTDAQLEKEFKNAEKIEIKVDSINRLNAIAMYTNVFQYDLIESSYFDAMGNNVYGTTNPSYLSEFFDKIKAAISTTEINSIAAKEALLNDLELFAQDPAMRYSNWLWNTGNNSGALNAKPGDPLTINNLNIDFLQNFYYTRLDGVKNTNTKEGFQYNNMPDKAWELTQLLAYMESKQAAGTITKVGRIPIIIPSDSGNIHFINSVLYSQGLIVDPETGEVTLVRKLNGAKTDLFQALENTVLQEVQRMKAARDLLFIVDRETGSITPKEHRFKGDPNFNDTIHLDYTSLQKNYYWKKQGKTEGSDITLPIIAEKDENGNWVATGNVFKFNNIPAVNNIKNITKNGVIWADLYGHETKLKVHEDILNAVSLFAEQQIERSYELFKAAEPTVKKHMSYTNFKELAAEYVLNSYLSNVEQFNFLVGVQSEFGTRRGEYNPSANINKRAKQIVAPGVAGSGLFLTGTYKTAVLKDIELSSRNYDMIAQNIANSLKETQAESYGKLKLNIDEVSKLDPDYTKMNELDIAVYNITKGYLETNVADGQGYVSLERAKNIIKDYGRWNKQYEALFEKLEKGDILQGNELSVLLQPFKGFYYGRDFNPTLGRHVSTQVKYSTAVLIPQLVKGTELEILDNWMKENQLDEIQFESAEKIGIDYTIDVRNKNGKVDKDTLDNFSVANGYQFKTYANSNWRLQLDVPDHMIDSSNKLGTQISKIILGNLPKGFTYTVAGDKYSRDEYIGHFMDVMISNITEDGIQLRKNIGVELENGEFVIKDMTKLRDVLMTEVERRGISDNYMEAIALDENGQFNMPLFINSMGPKFESILTSLFTNRIIDQKTPGASGVLLSSIFLEPVEGVISDANLEATGIQWIKAVKARGDYKLQMKQSKDNTVIYAEALMPAWSKKFYIENENGEFILDDINNIPEELRTMVTYRIPTERDYSATVITVVGFLPAGNGSTIVLPEEYVTAKGFDFDVDKEFIMYHSFDTLQYGRSKTFYNKYTYYTEKNDDGFDAWLKGKRAREVRQELKDNPTEAIKRAKIQSDRFATRQANLYKDRKEFTDISKLNQEQFIESINAIYGTTFSKVGEIKEYLSLLYDEANILLENIQEQYGLQHWGRDTEKDLELRSVQASVFIEKRGIVERQAWIKNFERERSERREVSDIKYNREQRSVAVMQRYKELYGDAVYAELKAEYNKLSDVDANIRSARDNRILDIFIAKLAHPDHFSGVHTPQSFADAASVMQEINEITGEKGQSLNPATVEAQLMYRKKNISGRALKGMAANSNAFLNIAQVAELFLDPSLGIEFVYKTGKLTEEELAYNAQMKANGTPDRVIRTYNKAELIAKYGAENVTEVEKDPILDVNLTYEEKRATLASEINQLNTELQQAKQQEEQDTGDQLNGYLATIEALKGVRINTENAKAETGGKVGGKQDINIGRVSNNSQVTVESLAEDLYNYHSTNIPDWSIQDYRKYIIDLLTEDSLVKVENQLKQRNSTNIQKELDQALAEYESMEVYKDTPSGNYFSVKHTNLGFNNNGTFTNINGANILDHSSQLLAMILDIVKEGIPFNVNTYTFSSYITMLNAGVDIRTASMYIRQPILTDLANTFFETQGFTEDERTGKEIQITKNKYVTELFLLINERDVANDTDSFAKMKQENFDKYYKAISEGKLINLKSSELTQLGVDLDNKSFNVETLKSNIKTSVKEDIDIDEHIEFLKEQIRVIESFKTYKKAGEAYDDVTNATGTDRTQVGPTLTRPETLKRQILKATYYQNKTTVSKIGKLRLDALTPVRINGEIMTYKEFNALRESEAEIPMINRTIKSDSIIEYEKGARIWGKVDGEAVPATISIFPELFEVDSKSNYSVLQTYYKEGFQAADQILSPLFIKQSVAFKKVVERTLSETGLPYSTKVVDKITSFLNSYVQEQLNWFKTRNGNRVVGVNVSEIKTNVDISLEEFYKLSAAAKLNILQKKMKNQLENDSHILNYLTAKLKPKDIAKNTMHVIEFINTKTDSLLDDTLTDSFAEMYFGNDPFQSSLAKDLLHYSFLSTGLSMRKNSFSKLIPTSVFKDIGIDTHLYAELNKSKIDTYFDSQFYNFTDKFLRSNSNDSDIVPYVYTKYKSGIRGTVNNTPTWKPDIKTGILTINRFQLLNEDAKVYQAPYVVVPIYKEANGQKTKVRDQLYAKIDIKSVRENIYYYPVDKLGSANLMEFTEATVLNDNKVPIEFRRTPSQFENAILNKNDFGMNDVNVNNISYSNSKATVLNKRNAADKTMFITATSFIGQEVQSNANAKTQLNKFIDVFTDKINLETYSKDSKVMVTAPSLVNAVNPSVIRNSIFDSRGEIKEDSAYYNIYNVLKAGGTVMFKSPVNENGDAVKTYKTATEVGNNLILQRLNNIVNNPKGRKLYKQVIGDIVYYSTEPINTDNLTNVERDSMKDNPNYNPNEKPCK